MDDSDQDFVDLSSKLLRRVRKKPSEPRQPQRAEHQPCSQTGEGDKRRGNNKKDGDCGPKVAGTQSDCAGAGKPAVSGGTGLDSGDVGSSAVPSAAEPGPTAERDLTAKGKVLLRMQQFKRASPQKLVHKKNSEPTSREKDCGPLPQLPGQGEMT